MGRTRSLLGLGISALALTASAPASAQADTLRHYQLPAQELGASIRSVALAAGQTLIAPTELLRGRRAPPVDGTYTPDEAVARLLAGTDLRVAHVGNALVIRRQAAESATDAQGAGTGADDEILVTGTRIRGRAPAGAAVTTIDRRAIEQSGYVTTQQVLQAVPQNFGGGATEISYTTTRNGADANSAFGTGINLRGLGPSSTLVLLNGERPPMAGFAGVFTDLSMVPISVVERIEVLPDGSSALYGSDAVAGVVNIVPRLDFKGLEARGSLGFADGFKQIQASAIGGVKWRGGRAVLGYEYYDRGALAASRRPYFSEDLRRFGLGDFRSAPGAVPGVTVGVRSFVVPAGQNGTALTPADFAAGTAEKGDAWAGGDALPAQRRHAVFGAVTLELGERLTLQGQGLYGARHFDGKSRAVFNASTVTVPVSNAFYVDPIGTHQPLRVSYSFLKELGPEGIRGNTDAVGTTASLHWSPGRWDLGVHATYGRQVEDIQIYNVINTARLATALADSNRATALNVLGNGTANNPATLNSLRGYYYTGGTYAMWSTALRADGPLVKLPAGDARLALGVEHRRERYIDAASPYDRTTLTPIVQPGAPIGDRLVTAGYAELALPLSRSGSSLGRLDVSAAVRGEHYSDFGDTVNPKIGATWEPLVGVRLRGTFGTSFRAPSFSNTRQGPDVTSYFAFPLTDPASPTGTTNAVILSGNKPGIGPERATSWTAGIDFRAGATNGLTAQLTWFDVDYRDRITNPGTALTSFLINRAIYAPIITANADPAALAAYFASPFYANYFGIPASQVSTIIDARTQNLARQRERGLDFDIGYRFALAGGKAELGASGSYIVDLSQRLTPSSPSVSLVGTLGYPPDLRVRGRAVYNVHETGLSVFANYIDGYANNSTGTVQHVGSWLTIDAQLSQRLELGPLGKLSVALSISNLFDADPPLTVARSAFTTIGIDLENANPAGRIVSLQLTKQW